MEHNEMWESDQRKSESSSASLTPNVAVAVAVERGQAHGASDSCEEPKRAAATLSPSSETRKSSTLRGLFCAPARGNNIVSLLFRGIDSLA